MTDGGAQACLRAGLLRVEGRMLVADTRTGTLRVAETPQQTHELVWTPTGASVPEVRVALSAAAPVVVERLPGPQRAVCVRQGSVRHAFFWLQDPATTEDADAQRIAHFNAVLTRLCTAVPPVAPATTQAYFLERLNAIAASQALTTPSQQPSTSSSASASGVSSASLERYFQAVLDSRTASVPEQQDLDLEELLKPDNVWECIKDDPETQQALLPLLPEGTQTLAGLREMVYSAQYRQTVQTLALVLQNGDAGPLLAEMRLPLDAQGPDNGITRFLTALMRKYSDAE